MEWIKTPSGVEVSTKLINMEPMFIIEQKFSIYRGKILFYAKEKTINGIYIERGCSSNKSYLKKKIEVKYNDSI